MTNPIIAAIETTRAAAMNEAAERAAEFIKARIAELEAAAGNLDTIAPVPNSFKVGRTEFQTMTNRRNFFKAITSRPERVGGYSSRDAYICAVDTRKVAAFIEGARAKASEDFDAYVAKLTRKIGECVAASVSEIDGSNVWAHSALRVTKVDGTVEVWKTRRIVNVSVYGKLFNQWPTRKAA